MIWFKVLPLSAKSQRILPDYLFSTKEISAIIFSSSMKIPSREQVDSSSMAKMLSARKCSWNLTDLIGRFAQAIATAIRDKPKVGDLGQSFLDSTTSMISWAYLPDSARISFMLLMS